LIAREAQANAANAFGSSAKAAINVNGAKAAINVASVVAVARRADRNHGLRLREVACVVCVRE